MALCANGHQGLDDDVTRMNFTKFDLILFLQLYYQLQLPHSKMMKTHENPSLNLSPMDRMLFQSEDPLVAHQTRATSVPFSFIIIQYSGDGDFAIHPIVTFSYY